MIVLVIVLFGLGFFHHLTSALAQTAAPISIGEINPLTGNLAKHGVEIHQGILYAVEEANARGGLMGRPVRLLSRDDQSRPEVAVTQTQDLIHREKVHALVGGYVDTLVGPISQAAAKYQTPYVASASLQAALTRQRRNPYFFRVSRLDGIVLPLGQFLTEVLKPQRVALIYAATPGAAEFAEALKAVLTRAGIRIPVMEKFRPGTPDFSMLILKVQMAQADVLVSGGFYPDNLILARQLREKPTKIKAFIAPWGVAYPSFIEALGQASQGLMGLCAWNPGIAQPGAEAESQRFTQGFRQRFGQDPTTTSMHGYTSARALLAAMEQVLKKPEELSGPAISRELRALDLTLPMERLTFDDYGDPQHYRQVVVQVQQGRMVVVYPPDRATGQVIYPWPRP
jgi:branched-chain amino acid transport system substrate-binding protein